MSLIEVLIASLLTMVGIMGLLSMQPQGYLTSNRSDILGRAAEILNEQLEINEQFLMNECRTTLPWDTSTSLPDVNDPPSQNVTTVRTSGAGSTQLGDMVYTVTTTLTRIDAITCDIRVRVTWPGAAGLSETRRVTHQLSFKGAC